LDKESDKESNKEMEKCLNHMESNGFIIPIDWEMACMGYWEQEEIENGCRSVGWQCRKIQVIT